MKARSADTNGRNPQRKTHNTQERVHRKRDITLLTMERVMEHKAQQ